MDIRELHAATGFSVACDCGVTHAVDVVMDGGRLTVMVDGVEHRIGG